jgi:arylsulfatase A-like enzyme
MLSRPNILLITIDSLRFDHLRLYGYDRETTPSIDALAKEGRAFLNSISHGGGTAEAFPSMREGVPPPASISQCDLGLKRGTSITRILKDYGYNTAAFNSNPYLSVHFGYDEGFDTFRHNLIGDVERHHTVTGGGIGPYLRLLTARPPIIRGRELSQDAVFWMSQAKPPFFAWIHYMDVHMPYLPPTKFISDIGANPSNRFSMLLRYRRMYRSNSRVFETLDPKQADLSFDDIRKVVDYYDGAIRYVDSCIADLVKGLEERGPADETRIIITADHGELLGEHGAIDHGYLYDKLLHVPLIVAARDQERKLERRTVTHLLVRRIIDQWARGEEFEDEEKDPDFADPARGIISSVVDHGRNSFSCRTERWKYIETVWEHPSRVVAELYNLKDDPGETENLSEEMNDVVRLFHGRIAEFLKRYDLDLSQGSKSRLSLTEERELTKRLRELGYE